MEVSYRIYTTRPNYDIYKTVYNMEDVLNTLDFLVNKQNIEYFLVIKNNGLYDDIIIRNIDGYLKLKGEMQDVSRGIEKVYRRT